MPAKPCRPFRAGRRRPARKAGRLTGSQLAGARGLKGAGSSDPVPRTERSGVFRPGPRTERTRALLGSVDLRGPGPQGPGRELERSSGNLVRFPEGRVLKAAVPMTDVARPRMRPRIRRHRDVAAVGLPGPARAREDVKRGSGGGSPRWPRLRGHPLLRFWIFPRKSKTSTESDQKVSGRG